jgi:hypothetical protein
MGLTLVSTTASERLLRHVRSLSEAEAEDVLRLLVHRCEQVMLKGIGGLDQDSRRQRTHDLDGPEPAFSRAANPRFGGV